MAEYFEISHAPLEINCTLVVKTTFSIGSVNLIIGRPTVSLLMRIRNALVQFLYPSVQGDRFAVNCVLGLNQFVFVPFDSH